MIPRVPPVARQQGTQWSAKEGFVRAWPRFVSASHEQGHQRVRADLPAPVAMHRRVECCAGWQQIGGVEMLTCLEDAGAAVLQADVHFAAENEHPLRRDRAVELAAKADRAVAQLVAGRREYGR